MVIMVSSGSPELDSALQFVTLKVEQLRISKVLLMLRLEVIDQASNDGRLSHLRGIPIQLQFQKIHGSNP